jgi:4-hydroxy-4-methyl-2-oxoglutarate aldolase
MDEQTNVHGAASRFEELDADVRELLTAAILADSLDSVGARAQVMSAHLVPLGAGVRMAGRARTARFMPSEVDPDDPYGPAMAFIDGLGPGTVPVIATGPDDRTAYWGELFSAAAKGHGAVGAVCDGPVRDVAKIRAVGLSVFAPATRPVDFRGRMQVVSTAERVVCGGVSVMPDDLVFADEDGVVVVPRSLEADVLQRSVSRATAERSVLEELLAGASLRQVWDRWHVL